MGTWRVVGDFGDLFGPVAAGAVLVVLVWAAIERSRVHHVAVLPPGLRTEAAALLARGFDRVGRFDLLRAARHAWRVHLAACAVLQWA